MSGLPVLTATVGSDDAFHAHTLWYVASTQRWWATKHGTFEVGMMAEDLAGDR
jgi:hypothetical protein